MSSSTDLGADYRAAKAAVGTHRRILAEVELERQAWLKQRRGVPFHLLFGADGEPTDPDLIALSERVDEAHADVDWCRALVVACGEAIKGETFAEAVERSTPEAFRDAWDRAMQNLEKGSE